MGLAVLVNRWADLNQPLVEAVRLAGAIDLRQMKQHNQPCAPEVFSVTVWLQLMTSYLQR